MWLINGIRSILWNVVFVIWTLLFLGIVVAPLCFLKSEKPVRWGVGLYCHGSVKLAHLIMGVSREYRGLENCPKEGAFILAAAHQSNMDPMLAYCVRPDVAALAKKELYSVPFVGSILTKMQIVKIDRADHTAHKGMDDVAEHIIELQRPLLVFPQATRVAIGKEKKLKSGAYFLQKDTDLPVVPVATNTGLFWGKGFWHRPGKAIYEFGKPIPKGLSKRAFMAQLEKHVVLRSNELVEEAGYGDLLPQNEKKAAV